MVLILTVKSIETVSSVEKQKTIQLVYVLIQHLNSINFTVQQLLV